MLLEHILKVKWANWYPFDLLQIILFNILIAVFLLLFMLWKKYSVH